MPKPEVIRKRNNVYFTPTATPPSTWRPSNVDPRTGEVIGKRMEHQSQSNLDSWWDVFKEIGEACPDRTQKRRTRR